MANCVFTEFWMCSWPLLCAHRFRCAAAPGKEAASAAAVRSESWYHVVICLGNICVLHGYTMEALGDAAMVQRGVLIISTVHEPFSLPATHPQGRQWNCSKIPVHTADPMQCCRTHRVLGGTQGAQGPCNLQDALLWVRWTCDTPVLSGGSIEPMLPSPRRHPGVWQFHSFTSLGSWCGVLLDECKIAWQSCHKCKDRDWGRMSARSFAGIQCSAGPNWVHFPSGWQGWANTLYPSVVFDDNLSTFPATWDSWSKW